MEEPRLQTIATPSHRIQNRSKTNQHFGITRTFTVTLDSPLSSSSDSYRVSSSKNKMGSRAVSKPRSILELVSDQSTEEEGASTSLGTGS